MAFSPELLDRLEGLDPVDWAGTVYRHMFAQLQPTLQNTGGARWNPKGTAAIYTSLERETALAEAEFRMSLEPIRPSKGRTLYAIRARISRVIDLRDSELLSVLGVTPIRLADPLDLGACRSVGGAAAFLDYGGILVPSARSSRGSNLVIFPTHPGREDEFEVVGTETISE